MFFHAVQLVEGRIIDARNTAHHSDVGCDTDTDYCFTVQVGNKSLINRHKFEEFLNQTTSL